MYHSNEAINNKSKSRIMNILDRGFDLIENKAVVSFTLTKSVVFIPKVEFFDLLRDFEFVLFVDHFLQVVTLWSDTDIDGVTDHTFEEFIFETSDKIMLEIIETAYIEFESVITVNLKLTPIRQGFNSILIRGNRKLSEWSKKRTDKIESQKFVNFVLIDPTSLLIRSNKRISKANFDKVVRICNS